MVAEDSFASEVSDRQLIIAQLAARNGEATEAEVGCSSSVWCDSRVVVGQHHSLTGVGVVERPAVDNDDDNTTAHIATGFHRNYLWMHSLSPGTPGEQREAFAKVTGPNPPISSHDRYDRHDPSTPSRQRQQRHQQQALPRYQSPRQSPAQEDNRSTPSSQRLLRRTPRFVSTPSPQPREHTPPRQVHLEAVSVGINPRILTATTGPPEQEKRREHTRRPRRQLSQDLSDSLEEASTTLPPSFIPPRVSSSPQPATTQPHPVVRISRHTHSAILWALEEALRHPNPFTPDLIEENASMAELLGGGPAVTNGNGGSTSRPTAPPAQTGSPSQGIRGPRAIMHARQEREAARQREQMEREREQMQRERAEQEARLLEEQRQRQERRAQAAGAGSSGMGGAGGADIPAPAAQPSDPINAQRRQRQASEQQARPSQQQQQTTRVPQGSSTQQQQRPTRNPAAQAASQQYSTAIPPTGQTTASAAPQAGESSTAGNRPRNSFPHAFERWEALSAHWEGLTSFWIRKLQQHAEDIDRDPLSSQLSRQVTDLSAAGANLFHAVVELQRLRASSERKFQRWFFETRAELERHQEVNAMLEAALEEERRGRSDAIRDAVEHERANSKTQKRMTEMQKELTISKEEARRAWEELGRREQEERDRTVSLQQGLPTIVGGVQVVPMTQGVPSRHGSSRDPRSHGQSENPEYGSQQQGYGDYSQAPPVQPANPSAAGPSGSGGFYQQPQATVHHDGGSAYSGGGGSEGGYSEGEYAIDAQGNFIRDSRGHKVPFRAPGTPGDDRSDSGTEEYETPVAQPSGGVSYPPSSSQYAGGQHLQQQQQQYAGGADYSGAGYAAPGWETVPRHHHPTRLSDVIEEDDERSRTSASQVSRG